MAGSGPPRRVYETLQEPNHESASWYRQSTLRRSLIAGPLRPDQLLSGGPGLRRRRSLISQRSVPIVLHPAPEPRPALKYQFLPPFPERRPGNAAVMWNRIPAERTNFFTEFNKAGGLWEKVEKWMEIPLGRSA